MNDKLTHSHGAIQREDFFYFINPAWLHSSCRKKNETSRCQKKVCELLYCSLVFHWLRLFDWLQTQTVLLLRLTSLGWLHLFTSLDRLHLTARSFKTVRSVSCCRLLQLSTFHPLPQFKTEKTWNRYAGKRAATVKFNYLEFVYFIPAENIFMRGSSYEHHQASAELFLFTCG